MLKRLSPDRKIRTLIIYTRIGNALMTPNRRKFWLLAFSSLFAVVGAGTFLALKPSWLKLPPCFFHEATGLYCPGCGSTRALQRILQGDLFGAFRCNLLTIPGLVSVVYLFVLEMYDLWVGVSRFCKSALWLGQVLLVLLIAFAILRNIPWHGFDFLRPPPSLS